ncbi:MAG: thioredoxin [Microgenomates group bacterium Gr01-1014_16]|nr:MAG: thioredoxin [Microgenomates group bacterium Gr01-1014_16]
MNPKLILSVVLVILVLLGGAVFLTRPPSAPSAQLDQFAKCLADKGITMYGADWCPHCQNQKKLFGSSFQYVPYVECPNVPKLCVDKGVNGYPTWILGDTKLEGEQSLAKLSEISSCPLP